MGLGEAGLVSSVLRCLDSTPTYLSGWSNGKSVDGACWSFYSGHVNVAVCVHTPQCGAGLACCSFSVFCKPVENSDFPLAQDSVSASVSRQFLLVLLRLTQGTEPRALSFASFSSLFFFLDAGLTPSAVALLLVVSLHFPIARDSPCPVFLPASL